MCDNQRPIDEEILDIQNLKSDTNEISNSNVKRRHIGNKIRIGGEIGDGDPDMKRIKSVDNEDYYEGDTTEKRQIQYNLVVSVSVVCVWRL